MSPKVKQIIMLVTAQDYLYINWPFKLKFKFDQYLSKKEIWIPQISAVRAPLLQTALEY